MGRNSQFIKLFIVLLFGTVFIFSFSHFGAKAFDKMANSDGKFSAGTRIGLLDVSGKTKAEVSSLLQQKYVDWVKDSSFELKYGEKTASFDLTLFHLDAKQTVESIKNGQTNAVFMSIDKKRVEVQVQTLFPQLQTSEVDMDKLTANLNATAAEFVAGTHSFDLFNDYASQVKKNTVLNTAVIAMKNVPIVLEAIIDKYPGIDIAENATFSLLDFAKQNRISDSDALSVLATGIYQVILPSNFSIVERNISTALPDYASLGYEAKVNPSTHDDLVFSNPNKTKYRLEFQLNGDQLQVSLTGEKFPFDYKLSTEDKQSLSPKTILQYSPLLLQGQIKILTNGVDGQMIKVYRDTYQDHELLNSALISQDYYPPVYQVEIHRLALGQQSTAVIAGTNQSQTGTTGSTGTTSNSMQSQPSPSTVGQQSQANNNDLWGKPNEQPK